MVVANALDIRNELNYGRAADVIEFPVKEKKVTNKKKGRKSEVYPFQLEDMKKMITYFEENERWLPYLLFVIGCNMARRVGDTLTLTWEHLYNPQTGMIRDDILEPDDPESETDGTKLWFCVCKEICEIIEEPAV